ncbi:Crp/Fnr family transcriptional regulator [Spirochaeta isovalerica]|uniref:CRP-like cAMP-binding protein n=1 Tax=Spirochaeta isovalerica TaxID=150 RepID=A0A841RAB5_9SPIO|nr:Crp/Fnr family transcriptional regulator [Spirochaeta isovalerica]MBB6479869.1 CRP-like cAMP-binding protein [Spirochaeta isovalerica]
MEKEIKKYLSKYIELTDDLIDDLSENLPVRKYPKGKVLLKAGEICNECYFILKGLIRCYNLREGDEITTDFYLEEQVASPSCYGQETPSDLYLECLEDTIAFVGSPQLEGEMLGKYPQLEKMARIMGEKMMSGYQDSYRTFKMSSPEERYLNLVENNPDLIQRAPQYQIASYLGIKPESLSRIRKRISRKG